MVIFAIVAWLVVAAVVLLGWPRPEVRRIVVPLLALVFVVVQQMAFATVPDSAFVTFRYAANIAAGHGAVFNIGEQTEGYSDFAWLVLVTLPKALFGADIVSGAVVLGVLCVLGAVLIAFRSGTIAGLLTAAVSGLAAYACAGSETPFFVLLVLAVILAIRTGHPLAAGVFAALAVMTRPDGVVLVAAGGLWLVFGAMRRRSTWWAPACFVLGVLVFGVPWLAWRATYYDHPLTSWPELTVSFPAYAFLAVALVAVGATEAMKHFRRPTPNVRPVRRRAPAAALALCALTLPVAIAVRPEVLGGRAQVTAAGEISRWLATRLPPGSIISTDGAGALAYGVGTRLSVVDARAGNNDYEFVASLRRPALAVTRVGYRPRQDCEIEPGYAGLYEVATFLRQATGEWVTVYPRGDQAAALIPRLDEDPALVYVPCPG